MSLKGTGIWRCGCALCWGVPLCVQDDVCVRVCGTILQGAPNELALGTWKSGHPESSQGPSDICNLYSQMLYQLSYSRLELLAPRRALRSVGGWARLPLHARIWGVHLECGTGVPGTTLAGLEPAIFRVIRRPVRGPREQTDALSIRPQG